MSKQFRRAIAYLDWGSAKRIVKPRTNTNEKQRLIDLENAVIELDNLVGKKLQTWQPGVKIRVVQRFYNGWHKGKEPSLDRILFERLAFSLKAQSRRRGSIYFQNSVEWGNELLCGERLFGTLRSRSETDSIGKPCYMDDLHVQKMVDTAIATDILTAVRSKIADYHLVVGDDDDLWPPILGALSMNAQIRVIRITRNSETPFLQTKDYIL